jgi:IgA Peptidase M64
MKPYLITFLMCFFLSCSKETNNAPILAIDNDFYRTGEVELLFENDPNGINIIFLGDGYIKKDLGKQYGSYRIDAKRHIDYLMDYFPFSAYRDKFNAYIIFAESEDKTDNTIFSVSYNDESPNPTLWDSSKLNNLILNSFPNHQFDKNIVLLSVNQKRGGRAYLGSGIAVFGSFSETTMVHEVGHAFASLGDEYFFDEDAELVDIQTIIPNLDITSDLNSIKWSQFIGLPNYSNVGAYEGGGYTSSNVWRPELKSIMGNSSSNNFSDNFNAPSREAIVKRINEILNMEYNFDTFLDVDSNFTTRIHTNTQF